MKKLIIFFLALAFSLPTALSQDGWFLQNPNIGSDLLSICFVDKYNGWAVDTYGNIIHSSDGGNNWIKQFKKDYDVMVWSIYFHNKFIGWACDYVGSIYYTIDGGLNWNFSKDTTTTGSLYYIQFIDSQCGWIVGSSGISKSKNGGLNWITQYQSKKIGLNRGHFLDSLIGWVVGDSGLILKTSDGGLNWKKQYSNINEHVLLNIFFINSLYGWAVGESGIIIHSTDGGENWFFQNSGVDTTLIGLQFINSRTGWSVGSNGIILFTTDGGENWLKQKSGTILHLTSVCFIDSSNGWVCGLRRTLLHTTNSGITFIENGKNDFPNIFCSPNPASDFIEIKNMNPRVNQWVDNVVIYNVMGENVLNVGAIHELPLRVDVLSLFPGLYFLRCGDQINKFMVVR